MSCQEASELLPWLLNGSLEGHEARQVREHLKSCPACRRELGETRWAAAAFGAHLPSAALVDLAWDRPPSGIDLDLARRHLETCSACAEELALVLASRRAEAEADRPAVTAFVGTERRPTPRRPAAVRYSALAASLAMAFGAGVLWRESRLDIRSLPTPTDASPSPTAGSPSPPPPGSPSPAPPGSPSPAPTGSPAAGGDAEQRRLEGRIAELEGQVSRLEGSGAALEGELRVERESRAALERQVRDLGAPQPNLPVVELFPGGLNPRSPGASPNQVVVPPGAVFVALLLNADRARPEPAQVEIRDAQGVVVWSGRGLQPSPLGGYTLGVPASLLAPGRYTITVRTREAGAAETYPIQVRRGP